MEESVIGVSLIEWIDYEHDNQKTVNDSKAGWAASSNNVVDQGIAVAFCVVEGFDSI